MHIARYRWILNLLLASTVVTQLGAGAFAEEPYVIHWLQQIGTDAGEEALSISCDDDGGAAIGGNTSGNLQGETNSGGHDAFLGKYDADGNQFWLELFGTTGSEWVRGVALDGEGGVFATGFSDGNLMGQVNSGARDIFVTRWSAAGSHLWTALLGTTASEEGAGIDIDSMNNIYVTGGTDGNLDGQLQSGAGDAFLCKYDLSGARIWTRLLGSQEQEVSVSVAVDRINGRIYIAGITWGHLDGNPYLAGGDVFISRYDMAGTRIWTRVLATPASEQPWDIAVDAASGHVFVSGFTGGSFPGNVSAGDFDAFIARFDENGTRLWVRQFGTANLELGRGIKVSNAVYAVGRTNGNLDGETNAGGVDGFLTKYTLDGTWLWTKLIGTPAVDIGQDVTVDLEGTIRVAGTTGGDLGGSNAGGVDIVVAKFGPPDPPVPAVSQWGALVIALSLLVGATLMIAGRRERQISRGQ